MDFNKNRCTLIFIMLLLVFSFQFSSAEVCEDAGFMGKFQQDSNVTLTQMCPTCTFINITVTDPNSEILFSNTPMILSNGLFSFGPNETISSDLGTYFVQGFSNLDFPFKSCYTITNISTEITIQESIIYVILTTAAFLMFLFCLWGGIGLPARNRRNELGRVIDVEILKYPKIALIFLSYAFFTWFINIIMTMSNSLVTLTQYQGFFEMIFNFLMAGLYAVFVAMWVVFFVLMWKDIKLKDLLTRGIQPR